ncbi:DUF503 family protein [Hydrocarboniclastica marina]|uniref:DUF503 family protein n=1 Tax=Hydrocarboniclastica marina TaxID=2259620 RepID=A0A4P7XJL6_9ALTE|nr:DUF503 family protein [Hydrocarboniclastica marina]MAL97418.1 hypothetical protein [Alteromonadaceae bacterium]QCF27311.1 DUF503 family protein [Hydrocarboniclastica marina]|tara:strand:- start:2766 stop:3077 length:312 start_codon:yes stop_codon:yes gene_type:complete
MLTESMSPPHVAVMTLRFQVYGCPDHKAKARAFQKMRTHWGKSADLAVAEVGDLESLDYATWTIATAGPSPAKLHQRLQAIELEIADQIDAPILDTFFEQMGG